MNRGTTDITLINTPPFLPTGAPLGLACLAAHLEAHGFRVEVLDLNIELYHRVDSDLRRLWTWKQGRVWERKELLLQVFRQQIEWAADRILETGANVLGFSMGSRREPVTCEMIKAIAERGERRRVVIGGAGCLETRSRDLVQREVPGLVDALVMGEGEAPLLEYMEKVSSGTRPDRRGPGFDLLRASPELQDLDGLAFPAYHHFDMDAYTDRLLFVEWSRGCVNRCTFCQIGAMWRRYRRKSPPRIVAELQELVRSTGLSTFSVSDSMINGDVAALSALCDLIIHSPLQIRWSGAILPREGVDADLTRRLCRSGCYRLEIGLESGSERVLKGMRKSFSVARATRLLEDLKEAGIMTVIFLIVGYPGETEEDFVRTLDFLQRNRGLIDLVRSANTLNISPESPLARHPQRFGVMADPGHQVHPYHWEDENHLDLQARNDRLRRLLDRCRELEIPLEEDTLEDTVDGYDLLQ